MKTKITIVMFCTLLASNALADFKHAIQPNRGNGLLDCLNIDLTLTNPNGPMDKPQLQKIVDSSTCEGYILGVTHAIVGDKNGVGIDGVNPPPVCPRSGVTLGQIKDIIKNYLYAHPESRDKNSSRLILAALLEAFPCSNTPAPPSTPGPTK
jgi:hypothetical protein